MKLKGIMSNYVTFKITKITLIPTGDSNEICLAMER